jgi:hypothetical protein
MTMPKKNSPKFPNAILEMLRTTLLVLEGREDLNHDAENVRELKHSIRSKIDALQAAREPARDTDSRPLSAPMFGYQENDA